MLIIEKSGVYGKFDLVCDNQVGRDRRKEPRYRQPTVQGGFHLLPSREMLLFISYFLFPQTGGSQRRKVKRETRT